VPPRPIRPPRIAIGTAMPNALTDPHRTGAIKGRVATPEGSQVNGERAMSTLLVALRVAFRYGATNVKGAGQERPGLNRRAHGIDAGRKRSLPSGAD
jgi:hypothetical protein